MTQFNGSNGCGSCNDADLTNSMLEPSDGLDRYPTESALDMTTSLLSIRDSTAILRCQTIEQDPVQWH